MRERVLDFLVDLSGRERALLVLLFFVALPVLIYFGALAPLKDQRDVALAELNDSAALLNWVAARGEEGERLKLVNEDAAPPPIGVSGVERSLLNANLRDAVSELSRRNDNEIELRFDAVPFVKLGDWLNAARLSWGYRIADFQIERGPEPGLVSAAFKLVPQS